MCGIIGFCGKSKPNIAALKLGAVLQISRGRSSTGFYLNGSMDKKTLAPDDYFTKWYFPVFNKYKAFNNVALVHNRQATVGAVNEKNSHPFMNYIFNELGEVQSKTYFIHNGTLTNIDELKNKYKIPEDQHNVDSDLLSYIITNHGFNVLTEYKGAAAFIYTDESQPHQCWVWKGASRQNSDIIEEERPLFYAMGKEGMYMASTKEALIAMLDVGSDDIHSFENNTLYHIDKGEIINSTYYDRSHIPKKEFTTTYYRRDSDRNDYGYNGSSSAKVSATVKKNSKQDKVAAKVTYNFKPESLEPDVRAEYKKNEIYFWRGRFYVNGEKADGRFYINGNNQIIPNEYINFDWSNVDDELNTVKRDYYYCKESETGVYSWEELELVGFVNGFKLKNVKNIEEFRNIDLKKTTSHSELEYNQQILLDPNYSCFLNTSESRISIKIFKEGSIIFYGNHIITNRFSKYVYFLDLTNNNYYRMKQEDFLKDPALKNFEEPKVELYEQSRFFFND